MSAGTQEGKPVLNDDALVPFGWAPGDYTFTCRDCPPQHNAEHHDPARSRLAAKRAWRCREHALEAALTKAERERAEAVKRAAAAEREIAAWRGGAAVAMDLWVATTGMHIAEMALCCNDESVTVKWDDIGVAMRANFINAPVKNVMTRQAEAEARAEAAEARAAAMEGALEEISGHAPVKTPPDYATSSDTGEAFDDGYSRGVWEMGQIADAALAPQAEAGEPG